MPELRAGTDVWTLIVIAGLTAITVWVRCFFFISRREWPLPGWARRGLYYAPIAALAAVIAPDILMTAGHLAPLWRNARFESVVCAALYCFWRRRDALVMPVAIGLGLLVYLPLRVGLGW
ncbi:MAG: AzlD domain-containing protein [Burkholderiaceae bacterium]|jgi:branched-subunit amino acid transport protein|nr:AzlD domain-containing protein [Burkholderiaceae bacterium]